MATLPRFYVYALARPVKVKREIDWQVFYIGKGTKRRVFKHEAEARRGCTCHKCLTIRKVWREGGEIQRYILLTTENEQEALDYECEMIQLHGRDNLCNHDDGGRGGPNPSAETRAKMSASHKGKKLSESLRAQITARVRQQALDPEWRKRVSDGTRRGQARTPDLGARLSEGLKERWANPDYKTRVGEAISNAFSTPGARAQMSARGKERFQDPDVRARQVAQVLSLDTPERRAKTSERGKELWADPDHRARRSAAISKSQSTPEAKKRRGELTRKRYEDPAAREQHSAMLHTRYEDPAAREKIRAGMARHFGYVYTITSPDGQVFVTSSLNGFCIERCINPSSMSRVARGVAHQHKGWVVTREKPIPDD